MLTSLFKTTVRRVAEPLALGMARLGFTPNRLTILGFILTLVVAAIISQGFVLWGGILVLVVSAFDTLDGALARATGQVTRFGAFLDSSLDRYAEGALFLGVLVYFAAQANQLGVLIATIALVGSYMVSYARARAEGLGLSCEVGWLPRPERIIILGLGLIFTSYSLLIPALAVIALFANLTAVQRMAHVWKVTKDTATPRAPEDSQTKA